MRPPFFLTCILILFSTLTSIAQPPEQFTYQAVIRDSNNSIIRNTTIGLRLSVLKDSSTSTTPLYSETHNLTTNSNGLITTEIGGGTIQSGDFSSIMWGDGIYFIKTEIDVDGGTDYGISGVTRVLSVPYALYARTAQMLPRMTTAQRDSIKNPEQGLQIFNLTTHCLELNMGSPTSPEWFQIGCLGTVDSLFCDSAVISQGLTVKTPTDGRTVTIPYTNGNSYDYPQKEFQSQEVSGLTLSLFKGRVNSGDGNITMEFAGTPHDTGTALFLIDVVTKSCSLDVYVDVARVDSLICGLIISNKISEGDSVNSISIQLSYHGGNGGYFFGDTIQSTEVLGMTAIIDSGYLGIGDDSIQINLRGVPMSNGVGYFPISIGGQTCSLGIIVIDSTPIYPAGYVHCFENGDTTDIIPVLNPITNRIWMDRNLGALQVADSSLDANSFGDLFQWGRFADGHQCRDSETTSTNSTTAVPNAGNEWDGKFIVEDSPPADWLVPQNDNLWQGVDGINNPCPAGYRLPNEAEWNAERVSWSANNSSGAFESPLKLPYSGHRDYFSGVPFVADGLYGDYWSSSVSGSNARLLHFGSGFVRSDNRAEGNAVRCIKD